MHSEGEEAEGAIDESGDEYEAGKKGVAEVDAETESSEKKIF